MSAKSGLWVEVSCDYCGAPLHERATSTPKGRKSSWTGHCEVCDEEWTVVARMVPTGSVVPA